MSKDAEYFRVPVTDFSEETSLPVDLYYEYEPNKIQRVAHKGSFLSIRNLPSSSKKQLQWLLLKKEDYRFYVNFSVGQAGNPLTSTSEIQKKLKSLNEKINENTANYLQQGISRTALESAQNSLLNVLHLIIENPVTFKLFEKIESLESEHLHSISVAIWSQLLAERLGWSGEPTNFRVILCALFHDVGFHDNPDKLVQKHSEDLTEVDIRILEGHVLRGRDLLSSIPGIPSEVITVAYQHHELVNGSGYPEKLFLDNIHPIARLISVANRFYELYAHVHDKKISLKEAFQLFKKEQNLYDLRFSKTLEELLHRK